MDTDAAHRPLFGVATGRFVGWWSERDMVWRDERGDPIGYVEAAWGPWSRDEAGDPIDWRAEPQEYTLYRFEAGRFGQVGAAFGEILSGLPEYGAEWAGRFTSTRIGPWRRAVPAPERLVRADVPPRPADRAGVTRIPGGLVDPEDCAYRGP